MSNKDLFSSHAKFYQQYRPTYPQQLFAWLANACTRHNTVWDCASGNGQAAVPLAQYFSQVLATDLSSEQLAQAPMHPHIQYRVAPAEVSGLEDHSVDLVTVAQAFHWLNHPLFFKELARVSRPSAVFAVWCYALNHVTPQIDSVMHELYEGILGPYWEPERRMVEDGYAKIEVPFAEMKAPRFSMETTWTLEQYQGYLRTWSSCRKYMQVQGHDPVDLIQEKLVKAWGDGERSRTVNFPLSFRVFRMLKE